MTTLDTITLRYSSDTQYKPRVFTTPTCAVMLLGASYLRFRKPIIVLAEYSNEGYWLVTNPDIYTHGMGTSCEEAVNDFENVLFDYFNELVNSEDVLAPHLKSQLNYLKSLIEE
jgi:hypothetical protein